MPHRTLLNCCLAVATFLVSPVTSRAQLPVPASNGAASIQAQPDFTLINLPTTRGLPAMKSAFRVTHRFGRSLTRGDFGQAAENLFGLDDGAQIGLEYRFGVMAGLQAGIYRTSDKTIQFFGQYDLFRQSDSKPATVDLVATIEGLNNFHKGTVVEKENNEYATSISVLLSRTIGDVAALYLQPAFIAHSDVYSTAGCLEDEAACQRCGDARGSNNRLAHMATPHLARPWTPCASIAIL